MFARSSAIVARSASSGAGRSQAAGSSTSAQAASHTIHVGAAAASAVRCALSKQSPRNTCGTTRSTHCCAVEAILPVSAGVCSNRKAAQDGQTCSRCAMEGEERMTHERPWLASYPEGIPAEIDVDEFSSVPEVLQDAIRKHRDRPAFTNMGVTLSYAEIDELSSQFASYLLGELKLKK